MLCDLCSLVVGSVNQPADMTRPLSLITHFCLSGCQHGVGQGGCNGGGLSWWLRALLCSILLSEGVVLIYAKEETCLMNFFIPVSNENHKTGLLSCSETISWAIFKVV